MERASIGWYEATHTFYCKRGLSSIAFWLLAHFEQAYRDELESDINVYCVHQRMVERAYWLRVAMSRMPVSD